MTFKTGDKGKTRIGGEYEVLAVLDRPLAIGGNVVAIIRLPAGWFLRSYHSNGQGDPTRQDRDDLLPPIDDGVRFQGKRIDLFWLDDDPDPSTPTQAKPTIHDLEALIDDPDVVAQLNPDGSVTTHPAYEQF